MSATEQRKVPRGHPVEAMTLYTLRRVWELQGAFLRLGSPRVKREAWRRQAEIRDELTRRGEELFV